MTALTLYVIGYWILYVWVFFDIIFEYGIPKKYVFEAFILALLVIFYPFLILFWFVRLLNWIVKKTRKHGQ